MKENHFMNIYKRTLLQIQDLIQSAGYQLRSTTQVIGCDLEIFETFKE